MIIANRRHTDLFAWGQRTTPPTLAAEIQRRLLPDSFSCEAGQLTVAGWLEPSGSIAGDTFAYALDRDALHVSITDAVGHSLDSALLATVLVSSLRNSRRRGAGLAEQARIANDDLAEHTTHSRFVTGQLARIELDDGAATIVNAGHPLPYRLRNGTVKEVNLAVDYPFGIRARREFGEQKLALEPGDRLVLLTDGMLERQPPHFDFARELARTADCTRARPPARWHEPLAGPAAGRCATTPRCCASTGTAAHHGSGVPRPEPASNSPHADPPPDTSLPGDDRPSLRALYRDPPARKARQSQGKLHHQDGSQGQAAGDLARSGGWRRGHDRQIHCGAPFTTGSTTA